jgi:hypothetical protein
VPDRLHGRAFAAYNAMRNGAELVALACGGLLVAAIRGRATLAFAGGISVAVALVGLILYRRPAAAGEPEPELASRSGNDSADPRGAQFEADFVNGWLEESRRGVPAEVARRYCECLIETLRRGRDTAELERLARATRRAVQVRGEPPAAIARASRSCAGRAS